MNDSINFKKHYDALPPLLRHKVAQIYDSFYLLLNRDMVKQNEDRLALCGELMSVLQSGRAEIKKAVDSCDGQVTDPLLLSNLMALQNTLKNDVCALLDKLMQADIDTAFEVKKEDLAYSERKAT